MGEADPDLALLDRLQAGDEAAFCILVRRYQASLLRLAGSLVGSRAVAEKAVQDTWLGVVRGIQRFEGRSAFKTWLFRILVNRARSAAGRERWAEPLVGGEGGPAVLADRFGPGGAWASPPSARAQEAEDQLVAEQLAHQARACCLPGSGRRSCCVMSRDFRPTRYAPCWASPTGICGCYSTAAGHGCGECWKLTWARK